MARNRWPKRIDNRAFREAVEQQGLPLNELALRLDWTIIDKRGYTKGDMRRVKRALGIGPNSHKTVQHKTALRLCEALGLDPHEVGG